MKFFAKIFKNKQVVTIAALILCFIILIVAYKYRVDKAINAVSVPIASRDLEPREKIDENCFTTKKVASSMLSANVITNKNDLLGDGEKTPAKYVNYNTFIPEGSLFYTSAVTTWDKMPDSAWSDIPDGKTMFSLIVTNDMTYGNSIFPGDNIDLFYSNNTNDKKFIGPLKTGIKVLAVKDESGNHIFKKSADQRNAKALIFAVDDKDFLFLLKAQNITGGKIIPVPRNTGYEPEESKDSTYIYNFIMNNAYRCNDDEKLINNQTIKVEK